MHYWCIDLLVLGFILIERLISPEEEIKKIEICFTWASLYKDAPYQLVIDQTFLPCPNIIVP